MKSRPSRNADARTPAAAAALRRAAAFETLEARQMLSVVVDRGIARINGTPGDDVIIVSRDPSRANTLKVSVNGFLNSLDELSVKRLQIAGGDGNDVISIEQTGGTVAIPAEIAGGIGNDSLTGGAGNDTIGGGRGNDVLKGGLGADLLDGGISNDTLYGGVGKDTLRGAAGDDTLYSGGDKADSLNAGTDPGDVVDTSTKAYKPAATRVKPSAVLNTPVGLTPTQIRTAYGFGDLSDASFTNRGAGQTIVIVDAFDNPLARQELADFSAEFGLPYPAKKKFSVVYAGGVQPQYDPGWAGEISLDVQWAHAIAPEARIILVEATSNLDADMNQAMAKAVELLQPTGGVISMSFGRDEFFDDGSMDVYFSPEVADNISFLASSGDFGAEVSHPAVAPSVTAVGGTYLPVDVNGNLTGPEVAWSGSGGGLSIGYTRPPYQGGITYNGSPFGDRRGVPDVAYNADPASGVAVLGSLSPNGDSLWGAVGGTSAGAPQWAGLVALANEKRVAMGKPVLGSSLNSAIYRIVRDDYANNFNDITQGTNGFAAKPGWDPVTGWGTPKASNLIDSLAADNSVNTSNGIFEGARLNREPSSPRDPVAQLIFGGVAFGTLNGSTFDLELVANANSGVSFDHDGPLTFDAGRNEYVGSGRVSIFIDTNTTITHNVRFVGHLERRHRRDVLVGEFYAASSRGKILYQGDKPAFYGTFIA